MHHAVRWCTEISYITRRPIDIHFTLPSYLYLKKIWKRMTITIPVIVKMANFNKH